MLLTSWFYYFKHPSISLIDNTLLVEQSSEVIFEFKRPQIKVLSFHNSCQRWNGESGVCLSWSPSTGHLESQTEESTCCFSSGWGSVQVRGSQSAFDSCPSGTGLSHSHRCHLKPYLKGILYGEIIQYNTEWTRLHWDTVASWNILVKLFSHYFFFWELFFWLHFHLQISSVAPESLLSSGQHK